MSQQEQATLAERVRVMVIEYLALELDPATVDIEAPLFSAIDTEGVGLGLDSIDALELVVALNETFGIQVSDEEMEVFRSIRTIADYVGEKLSA